MILKVITEYPVALDSNDHLYPKGTSNDNHTDPIFIDEVERYFGGKQINYADLGCAGGQLALDFLARGHTAIGLEGSDYSAIHKRVGWAEYYNKNLFTCDLSRPCTIMGGGEQLQFDCITAWEVLEHLNEKGLHEFMKNVVKHLKPEGIFCASVTAYPDYWDNGQPPYEQVAEKPLHITIESFEWWRENIFKPYIEMIEPYPFSTHVRSDVNPPYSMWFAAKKLK